MSSRTWMGWACLLAFCYCHKIPFKVKSAIHIALHCHVWGDTTYKAAKSNMEPEKAKLSRIPCLARERERVLEKIERVLSLAWVFVSLSAHMDVVTRQSD